MSQVCKKCRQHVYLGIGHTCPDTACYYHVPLTPTSPSRARPSDRAIAQAFWESRGDTADCDWIAVRARQLDSEGAPVERWTSDDEVRYLLGLIEEHGDGEAEYSLRAQHMMADIRRRLSTQPETPEARAGDCDAPFALLGFFDPDVIEHFRGGLIDPVGVIRRKPNGTSTIPIYVRTDLTTKATP